MKVTTLVFSATAAMLAVQVAAVGSAGGASTHPATKVKTFAVSSYSSASVFAAVDSRRHLVYAAGGDDGTEAAVVNELTNSVTKLKVTGRPEGVAVSDKSGDAYLPGGTDGTVTIVRGKKVIRIATLGGNLTNVTVDGKSGHAYVTDGQSDTVYEFNGSRLAARVHTSASSERLAANPVNGLVYVVHPNADSVSVIKGAKVVADVAVGKDPSDVAIDSATGRAYVANAGDGTVSVLDGARSTAVRTISVGQDPMRLVANSRTGYVYVANWEDTTLSVLKGTELAGTIQLPNNPSVPAVDPSAGVVAVATNGHAIEMVRGLKVVGAVSPATTANAMTFDRVRHYLFVVLLNGKLIEYRVAS